MRHEQSNVMPPKSIVELDGIFARITLTDPESVTQEQDAEGQTVYNFDRYVINRPSRATLASDVAENFEAWLEIAKAEDAEKTAAELRAVRNRLLQESDCELSLDRLGLTAPEGSTFASWLSFLRRIGDILSGKWARYRQDLRDLPAHPNWPYLQETDWPEKPTDASDD